MIAEAMPQASRPVFGPLSWSWRRSVVDQNGSNSKRNECIVIGMRSVVVNWSKLDRGQVVCRTVSDHGHVHCELAPQNAR